MRIGLIGLGKMGANLAMNFKDHNHDVLGYDLSKEACNSLAEQGIHIAENEDQLIQALDKPRVIWLMLPCGNPTDSTIRMLSEKLEDGDIVIDGGNSRYTDSIQHAKVLEKNNIRFLVSIPWWRSHPIHENRATESIWTEPLNPRREPLQLNEMTLIFII